MATRYGTRIEFDTRWPGVIPQRAKIVRPRRGESTPGPEWHIIQFDDGGKLCVHESNFRIVDNR